MTKKDYKFDCRYFDGGKPCRFKARCNACRLYEPIGKKILIIKLASAGDVLRTTALLPALRKKYPDSYITWLVRSPGQELLEANPYIDRILVYNLESVLSLQSEKFDWVISLDKAIEAASLGSLIRSGKKSGFGLNESGKVYPFNTGADYAFMLGLDDELKFHNNKKTYQELIFDIAGIKYKNEKCAVILNTKELDFADSFFKKNKLNKNDFIIGLNSGAGKIFANKFLRKERTLELANLLVKRSGKKIMLLGGPQEEQVNEYIIKKARPGIINAGCGNSLKEFCALVDKCSLLITADTLALHIASALKKPVVALFGPTCHQEIKLFNGGEKIVSDMDCAPCYRNECRKQLTCMDNIKLERIAEAVKKTIAQGRRSYE